MAISVTLLALAWVMWFPFAFRERKMPLVMAWAALVVTCAAVIIVALFLPYACRPCVGLL
jgi:hypothetical protein